MRFPDHVFAEDLPRNPWFDSWPVDPDPIREKVLCAFSRPFFSTCTALQAVKENTALRKD